MPTRSTDWETAPSMHAISKAPSPTTGRSSTVMPQAPTMLPSRKDMHRDCCISTPRKSTPCRRSLRATQSPTTLTTACMRWHARSCSWRMNPLPYRLTRPCFRLTPTATSRVRQRWKEPCSMVTCAERRRRLLLTKQSSNATPPPTRRMPLSTRLRHCMSRLTTLQNTSTTPSN